MRTQKLSINKVYTATIACLVLMSFGMTWGIFILTNDLSALLLCLLYNVAVLIGFSIFVVLIRKKLTIFSDTICALLDDMLSGEMAPPQIVEEESLFYKIHHRLLRLYEIMCENRNVVAKERADLQELISDISHQVKTPITNLKMLNSILHDPELTDERRQKFLSDSEAQLDKLDFLMQAMIKTSRLETGIIALEKKKQKIYDTLAAALGGILLNAEKKSIDVSVDCPEDLIVSHDRKWTSEAIFNILDNAVKYTPAGGKIRVSAESWEMYLKIDVTDTGKGIAESRQGTIFKRFYREEDVHDIDGLGIGLYLAREIISMQGGYIKVVSELGKGSTFSVFLPHE